MASSGANRGGSRVDLDGAVGAAHRAGLRVAFTRRKAGQMAQIQRLWKEGKGGGPTLGPSWGLFRPLLWDDQFALIEDETVAFAAAFVDGAHDLIWAGIHDYALDRARDYSPPAGPQIEPPDWAIKWALPILREAGIVTSHKVRRLTSYRPVDDPGFPAQPCDPAPTRKVSQTPPPKTGSELIGGYRPSFDQWEGDGGPRAGYADFVQKWRMFGSALGLTAGNAAYSCAVEKRPAAIHFLLVTDRWPFAIPTAKNSF